MRTPASSRAAVSLLAVGCILLTACQNDTGGGLIIQGGGNGSSEDVYDMAGSWTLTVDSVDLPFAFDCTEDLAGSNFSFCGTFDVTVTQDGMFFLPEQSSGQGDQFCDSIFVMSGASPIEEITGVIARTHIINIFPPEFEFQTLEFNAVVVGDSGRFLLVRLTVQDLDGECTLGGSYRALRTVSP